MKCPYRDFQDCLVEQCPSRNYETTEETVIKGRAPAYMSFANAIDQGYQWVETVKTYRFVSCKLVDNNVQPIPATNQTINNTTRTNVVVRKSIF